MNYLTSKMKITIVGALIAALLFVQCNKMDDLNVRLEERYTTEFVEAAQTGALFRCAQCTESNTKITGNRAQLLAQNFAPLLKFDRAAPDTETVTTGISTPVRVRMAYLVKMAAALVILDLP